MSYTRRSYSPVTPSLTYRPSTTTLSPSYSYSRVSTYLDALQKDQTVMKLKKQLTHMKSVQIRYNSLLQQIAIAEKQNRLLQAKNNQIEEDYMNKLKSTSLEVKQMEEQLEKMNKRMNQEEKNVENVQVEVQQLLEELKKYKCQQEAIEKQNQHIQKDIQKSAINLINLTQQHKKITYQRNNLQQSSKQTTHQMQQCMSKLSQATQSISKYQQQLQLLQQQSHSFKLQQQNLQTIVKKNTSIIQTLQRKLIIQQGENQQLTNQVNQLKQQWQKIQTHVQKQKQKLYENVISVEEKSIRAKETLKELDYLLEKDSTEKKYLKDISNKQNRLEGENQRLRELIQQLNLNYEEKNMQEIKLVEKIKAKIQNDLKIKDKIQQRSANYQGILKDTEI